MSCKSVVYITIEYCEADLFSGNGICARSHVRQLAAASVRVHVICGRPKHAESPEPTLQNVTLSTVPLDTWFSTECACSHSQFATGTASILNKLDWSTFDACLAVDWTGTNALRNISVATSQTMNQLSIPIVYLNLRSYMSMTNIPDSDRQFYTEAERAAVHMALKSGGSVVSLCKCDDVTLQKLVPHDLKLDSTRFHVLLPMLRSEFQTIAQIDKDKILNHNRRRTYLTCLVRLSEDKGPHRFVRLLERLQQNDPDIWEREGIVPLLLGAPTQIEYAHHIRKWLKNVVSNAVIMDSFLLPQQLATILQNSVLNIHPALYEAYGMTIVEAAAMGCPSIVHCDGIGATQLLQPKKEAIISLDLSDEDRLVEDVSRILADKSLLSDVAHRAYEFATSWTESEHGQRLVQIVNASVAGLNEGRTED